MRGLLKWLYKIVPFKRQIFTLLRRMPISQAIYQHLYFSGVFKVEIENKSFKMIHYGYELENEIFWKGLEGWEKTTFKVWSALATRANCIVDIGANTGVFSLIAKTLNNESRVIAFEPVKRVFKKLNKNVRLNDFDITVVEAGLSNRNGIATIFDVPTEHIYSVTINKNLNASDQVVIPTEIATTTLTSFINTNQIDSIDLIKIDVETHEPEVLEGMIEILKRDRPSLIIEILNDEVAKKVDDLLGPLNYSYFVMNDKIGPQRVASIRMGVFKNYLVCTQANAEYLESLSVLTL